MELKRRYFDEHHLSGRSQFVANGVIYDDYPYSLDIGGTQLTWSQGNKWPNNSGRANVGGPFDTIRVSYDSSVSPTEIVDMRAGFWRVVGNILPIWDRTYLVRPRKTWEEAVSLAPSLGDDALAAQGSVAINRCAPTKSHADLMTTIIETFREGIPQMVGSQILKDRARKVKSAGSEYLNYEFGWLPLVSDIRNAAQAVIDSEKILRQLARDSGRNVRRSYHFGTERNVVNEQVYPFGRPFPNPNSSLWSTTQPSQVIDSMSRSIWFDGCFTYHFDEPSGDKLTDIANQARILLGLDLSPSTLWELAPWSWLSDWVFNVGPVLSNLSMFQKDGLTLRYGYVMERTNVSYRERHFGFSPTYETPGRTMQCTVRATRKRRIEVSPYSLGLVGRGLTLRQAAILSALGVTRGKHN